MQRARGKRKKRFNELLSEVGKNRRRRRVTRAALTSPTISPFVVLLNSQCDQSMITVTGFDHRTFVYLLRLFKPLYDTYTPYSHDGHIRLVRLQGGRRGRPRSMDAVKCLGLILAWHRTRGSMYVLNIMFGVTESVCNLFIRFARRILAKVLSKDDNARVKMPTATEYDQYRRVIAEKYPSLGNTFGTADGLKLYLEQCGDSVIQNMFYNGWKCDHYVNSVLVFVPSGLIVAAVLNGPGTMHDSLLSEWGGIYEKLESFHAKCGGTIVVDSAFDKGSYPFLIKSAQDETRAEGSEEINLIRQATSMRQASEWGMRMFQGSFPRMKDRFIYEERGERKLMLMLTVLLFNIRTKLVGLNQIQSVFMPHLSVEASFFIHKEFHI